jgi:hypothetical protein
MISTKYFLFAEYFTELLKNELTTGIPYLPVRPNMAVLHILEFPDASLDPETGYFD